ncbi:MAG: hypothetical protein AAF586_01015 [Planctomycetota bacterium]
MLTTRLPLVAAALLVAPALAQDAEPTDASSESSEVVPETYYAFTDLGGMTVPEALSREGWGEQTVMPVDGRTVHNPTYAHPIELRGDASGPLAEPTVEERMVAALAGAKPMNYDGMNVYDTAMGWGWFAADAASLIPRMIFQPPLANVTTPPGVSEASWGFMFPEPVEVIGGGAFDEVAEVVAEPDE